MTKAHAKDCVRLRPGVHLPLPHLPDVRGLHGLEPGLHGSAGTVR